MGVYVTIPPMPGDVAQVEDLPAGVAEAFGINVDSERVSRREAFSIPAFRKGVQRILLIAQFALEAQRVAAGEDGRTAPTLPDRAPVRRSLLEQPDPNITVTKWLSRVLIDLVCEPFSWCRITRRDTANFPLNLEHMDYRWLRIDPVGNKIFYCDVEVPLRDVVRFDSPLEDGALRDGAAALRTALELEATVRRYAKNPMPLGVLSDPSAATAGGRDNMSDSKVQKILDKWELGALKRVVRWIGRLKFDAIQFNPEQLQLNKARERSDLAISQLLGLTPDDVSAPSTGSDTYRNLEAEAADRLNTIRPYMLAITQRLSMADITPRGQVVKFNTTAYVRGTTVEVIGAAVNATNGERPLMSVDEARSRFLDLPPIEVEDAA